MARKYKKGKRPVTPVRSPGAIALLQPQFKRRGERLKTRYKRQRKIEEA